MKKKMVCMMLVSAMLAVAMTGCGNASEATGEAETANTTGDTAVADNSQDTASGTPVEVEFWYSGGKTADSCCPDFLLPPHSEAPDPELHFRQYLPAASDRSHRNLPGLQ